MQLFGRGRAEDAPWVADPRGWAAFGGAQEPRAGVHGGAPWGGPLEDERPRESVAARRCARARPGTTSFSSSLRPTGSESLSGGLPRLLTPATRMVDLRYENLRSRRPDSGPRSCESARRGGRGVGVPPPARPCVLGVDEPREDPRPTPRRGGGHGAGRVGTGRTRSVRPGAPRGGPWGEGKQAAGAGAAPARRVGWPAGARGRSRARRTRGQRRAAAPVPSRCGTGQSTASPPPIRAAAGRGAAPRDGCSTPPARDLRPGGGDLLGAPPRWAAPPHHAPQGLRGHLDGLPRPPQGGLPGGHPVRGRRPRGGAQPPQWGSRAEHRGLGRHRASPRGGQAARDPAGGPPGGGGALLGQPQDSARLAPWP